MTQLVEASRFAHIGLSTPDGSRNLPRHRWYTLKEGFSEALVREAVASVAASPRALRILDPFCGSGTSLVAAGRLGLRATGIEVSPFLAFATDAKCTPGNWDRREFDACVGEAARAADHPATSPLEGYSTFSERPGLGKWLFGRSVLRSFTSMDAALAGPEPWRAPLRLALLASAMACSNVKRDGKGLRYKTDWYARQACGHDLRESFLERAAQIGADGATPGFAGEGVDVVSGDARERLGELEPDSYDLVVTSPPYLNSLDYCDVYRPELFLGGFVRDNGELRQVRLKTVRSHVQVGWEPSDLLASPMVEPVLDSLRRMDLWDPRLPAMVQSYFADLACVLNHCSCLVRRGGAAWITVSTSAYAGVDIPVDLIVADVAARNGWGLEGVYVLRQLRSSGQQWAALGKGRTPPLRESLVVLRR